MSFHALAFLIMRSLIVFALLLVSLTSRGDIGGKHISRGGFGFLFPDQNSTTNVGEVARSQAFAVQLSGAKFTGTHEMSMMLSSAFSTGSFAISGYGTLYGKDPLDKAQRTEGYGAALGFLIHSYALSISLQKEQDIHWTIARVPTEYALKIGVSKTWDTFSFGFSTSGTSDDQGTNHPKMEVALGLKGKSMAVESLSTVFFQDNTWSTGLLGKWEGDFMYASAGTVYLSGASALQILARAGFHWHDADVSAFVTHIIKHAENPYSGASIRFAL